MRLRKNMKRTAAAVLALSMAVSAVAAPASAAYICDVSQGNVVVSVDKSGNKTIKVGDKDVQDNKDGTDDIIITGDNTKPTATESLNAEDENTSEVEKSGENASEVEKSGETKTEGEDKTQNSAAEGEDEGDEPTSQELLAPEDEEKQAQEKETQEKPADSQEPEQTEQTSDQVIEYGQYDPEAQQEATKLEAKPVVKQETEEKKPAEEKTYGDTNAPTTLSEKAQAAANNVVKIINDSKETLKVILRNLKVDAGESAQNAMTIQGDGDVTLELDGKNELTGGSRHNNHGYSGGHGLYCSYTDEATITIQDEDKNGSLTAVGGDVETSSFLYKANRPSITGGDGIHARNLTVSGAEIKAEGGDAKGTGKATVRSIGGAGIRATEGEQWLGMAKFLDGAHITAKGGDAYTENASTIYGGSGILVKDNVVIEGVSISAAAGSAESKNKAAYSGSAMSIYAGNYLSTESEDYTLSMKDSTLELTGGSAKGKTAAKLNSVFSATDFKIAPTMKNLTITAVAGKGESPARVTDNGMLNLTNYNMNPTEIGGNSTINLVGTKTGGVNAKDNTVVNLYVPKDETLNKSDSVDKITADETGKVNIYENATTTKNDDGTITVTGDLTGIKKGELQYKPTDRVEPTCTTPGKQTYTCTTEGHEGETYEETLDALGHEFVNGICTRCGAPEQAAAENGGSSAVTLTVTGAGAYETSIAEGRYVVAVPAEAAVLSGCLSNLKELKAQGVNTIVFRTQLRETALNIDSMLSLGVDDTLFALTHSGESAELTVGGFAHNELLH